MTDPRETLAEIRARADAATEGPWSVYRGDRIGTYVTRPDLAGVAREWSLTWSDADAEFIAHARADVPVMAAALTAALHALDDLDSKHQIHGHECLCGFTSARSRSRTEHLTAEVRAAITTALQGETP